MRCYCDEVTPSVYKIKIRLARKPHVCSECFRKIHAGEKYEHVFGIWDGLPSTFKTCERCLALKEFITAHVPCFCVSHGNLIDDLIETAREHDTAGLLFGAYRRLVKIQRQPRVLM